MDLRVIDLKQFYELSIINYVKEQNEIVAFNRRNNGKQRSY